MSHLSAGFLMPCQCNPAQAREAVESVLAQTRRDFEFLIIDDASGVETSQYLEWLRDPRVRVLRNQTSRGVAGALNQGLAALKTDVVVRMDADDVAMPQRLELQMARLESDPELAVLGSNMVSLCAEGVAASVERRLPETHSHIASRLCWSNAINHPTVVFRREAVLAAGGYNEAFVSGQDYDLWTRMITRWKFANLRQELLEYRIHANQNSRKNAAKDEMRDRIRMGCRKALTGVTVSPSFDRPDRWTVSDAPSAEEWAAWLDFLEKAAAVFATGKIGVIQSDPLNARRDLARRLCRCVTSARKIRTVCPAEAVRLLKKLAPVYALLKGVF